MVFTKLFGARSSRARDSGVPAAEYPLEVEARMGAMHARAPVRRHLDILYDGVNIGAERFADLYFRCLERTGTAVTPFNIFQRFQTRHDLLRYFEATFSIAGARVECGAYRGATGLLLCHAWRALDATFDGRGLYLVDSFSGTAESGAKDLIPVRGPDGVTRHEPFFPPRKSDVTADMVERFFDEFPAVRICEGWIPQVFDSIGETRYAFVHVDLTLYEATLAALTYFHPRLAEGGAILCDGSLFCPGVEVAVEEFALRTGAAYATLGHRQFVFLKHAA
ncbi:MAG: TylF/MycF/NovP-related O-methyltransferase [Burkholderiales bacterium]